MVLAVDVYYKSSVANIIAFLFDWQHEIVKEKMSIQMDTPEEYKPGRFYKRELPCIIEVLKKVDLQNIDCIIVDGHVYINDSLAPGLGGHLYNHLNMSVPVIGVAKRPFFDNRNTVIEIIRGEGKNPLYISAAGMDKTRAADLIKQMKGKYRIPALLKQLDMATKQL